MPFMAVKTETVATLEVKGSRFIAYLIPIGDFESRVEALWTENRKASHIVTATRRLAEDQTVLDRAKDDGEPGGTAGMPVLKVMVGAEIVEAGIAVVRYFGGTKLGTGGLARAYGGAAALVVAEAHLSPWQNIVDRSFKASFSEAGMMETTLAALPLTILNRVHTAEGAQLMVRGAEEVFNDPRLAVWMSAP